MKPIEPKRITIPQDVRELPGCLNDVPTVSSNSPELILQSGILLSTFSKVGKTKPEAHLDLALSNELNIFLHHVTNILKASEKSLLHLAVLIGSAAESGADIILKRKILHTTNPDASFKVLPPVLANDDKSVFAGPGDRVTLDLLTNSAAVEEKYSLAANEIKVVSVIPVPTDPLFHQSNGATAYYTVATDGPIYVAVLASFKSNTNWIHLLTQGSLCEPRDRVPTQPGATGPLVYGRVAGVTTGSKWTASVPTLDLEAGQQISWAINTLVAGSLGTDQVQAAPLAVRYKDTAYASHGNYSVLYDIDIPLHNGSDKSMTVDVSFQTPLKDSKNPNALSFFDEAAEQVFFRGTIEFDITDELGSEKIQLIHLVQKRGQKQSPLTSLLIKPGCTQNLRVKFYYPPDCTPPHVLSISTVSETTAQLAFESASVISSPTHVEIGGRIMGWLDRLFGNHNAQASAPAQQAPQPQATATAAQPIPPERVGLNGEYDQSGLAKRVAKAFDEAGFSDHQTVWIAQTGTTVVLKGTCHDQDLLNKMVATARGVHGAQAVETNQVKVGS